MSAKQTVFLLDGQEIQHFRWRVRHSDLHLKKE